MAVHFRKGSTCDSLVQSSRTMLHWWLIPIVLVFWIALGIFYVFLRAKGGTGVRTEGRTLVDKPEEEPPFDQRE